MVLKEWTTLPRGYRFGVPTFYNAFHRGLDVICASGTPIFSPRLARVAFIRDYDPYIPEEPHKGGQGGKMIILKTLDDNKIIRFLHLSSIVVKKDDIISEGTTIGYTGNSGLSTNAHLHIDVSNEPFDLYNTSNFINPEKYFMIGKIKFIVFKDTPIDTEQTKTVMSLVSDWVHTATEGKLQVEFDIQEVDFKNDSVRKIAWTTDGKYIPDWWMAREFNHISNTYGDKYSQALYLFDEANWYPHYTGLGGFNKGVNYVPGGLHIGMDFVLWGDLIGNHLGKSFNEGMRVAITEEFAHDLDNWGQLVEPKLDLPTFFDVASKPMTSDGSLYDSYVVHAKDSRYARWEHEHIFNKLKEYLAQWFECAECEPLPINTNDMKLYIDKQNRVWAEQNGFKFWILDPATRDDLIKACGQPIPNDVVPGEYVSALVTARTDEPK